jgi:hypothetical protein
VVPVAPVEELGVLELEPLEELGELELLPDELGEVELLPMLEPDEPEVPAAPPEVPPAPIDPVLLPELALPEVPAPPPASEPPLPQADSDSAAAAMMASAVPRVNFDAFMEGTPWLGLCLGGTRKRQPALPETTLGSGKHPTVVWHCRTL